MYMYNHVWYMYMCVTCDAVVFFMCCRKGQEFWEEQGQAQRCVCVCVCVVMYCNVAKSTLVVIHRDVSYYLYLYMYLLKL